MHRIGRTGPRRRARRRVHADGPEEQKDVDGDRALPRHGDPARDPARLRLQGGASARAGRARGGRRPWPAGRRRSSRRSAGRSTRRTRRAQWPVPRRAWRSKPAGRSRRATAYGRGGVLSWRGPARGRARIRLGHRGRPFAGARERHPRAQTTRRGNDTPRSKEDLGGLCRRPRLTALGLSRVLRLGDLTDNVSCLTRHLIDERGLHRVEFPDECSARSRRNCPQGAVNCSRVTTV